MNTLAKIIQAIGNARGNDKLYILQKYAGNADLKAILKFIYNPYCKTGIASSKLGSYRTANDVTVTLHEALDYFKSHQTGSEADVTYAWYFINTSRKMFGDDAARLAIAIVTQDLKIGVTATSLNKVYGKDFIPKTGCMLGTLYGDVGPAKTHWPCIVTEKLDGIRRILVKENGNISCYSRSGHLDEGLVDIFEEAKYLPDNFVYDGELLAIGSFTDCIAQRQATNSIANSKGIRKGLTFNVFDMIPVDEFFAGKSKERAQLRKLRLGATLKDESIQLLDDNWAKLIAAFGIYEDLHFIRPVPILGFVRSLEEAEPIVNAIWSRGGEGIMLNTTSGLYEIKRSKELLKVKHTEEHVLPIIDMIEGTGKYEGMLGALVVVYKGNRLGVGSGFTDQQRQYIWDNYSAYIGAQVEIETFGESTNALGTVSLNCPIFKRFVGEEE